MSACLRTSPNRLTTGTGRAEVPTTNQIFARRIGHNRAKGQREVIAHGANHRRLALNAWHPFSVTIKGRTISAVAAGDLRVEHTMDRAIGGRVGLWTKRDSITAFRNWRAE